MKKKPATAADTAVPSAVPRDHGRSAAPDSEAAARLPAERSFPIVGLGASAGGLAAFEAFFRALPADSGVDMAFVLVQHLAPDHPSILTELIQRYTTLPVHEVTDGVTVQRNSIYVIPPNRDLAFLNGTLHLLEPVAPRGQRLAIDFFFRSLAQDQHERAIAIVLSGTGSDGTGGVREIKGEGGMVMAQAPDSTDFDGMPRNAIATGMVDFVLSPAEMPGELLAYCGHAFGRAPNASSRTTTGTSAALHKIFVLLRAQTGHDFSQYKQTTIARRVERRQAVHRIQEVDAYVRLLQQSPGEVDALFLDLLIGVTSFFRDPEAFAALEAHVIPSLFANRPADAAVRVWVPACSSGEEAYSIAILLIEYQNAAKRNCKLQVFATDIDRRAIDCARIGRYPASVAADLTPERLARFFTLEEDGTHYRIQKRVRDVLVFSEQNVVRDPPFSRLDLISCRNLLIYLGGDLHKRLIPLFDYALRPGGHLFLGTSETIGDFGSLFSTVDRKAKIYQDRDDGHVRLGGGGRFLSPVLPAGVPRRAPRRTAPNADSRLRELTESALLQHQALAGALVNDRGDILYLHGRTGQYLELASGELETNILKMARDGLNRPLGVALRRAVARKERVYQPGLSVKTNGDFTLVDLTVQPVDTGRGEGGESVVFLVILEAAATPLSDPALPVQAVEGEDPSQPVDARIEALTRELRMKEESLQISNEELETSNEELKSSNEEMQSVNEELQSTNEEMETSKEELQSVNEELSTVNVELQSRVADLSQANNDMNNLLAGTGVGTIFVGHGLQIKRFTPSVTQLINLIPTDVGRSVGHIVSNLLGYNHLVEDVQRVLDTLVPMEVEVQSKADKWFLLRIRPYRTLENVIEGAVITFTDMTDMKQAQAALIESRALERLAVVVRDSNDAITVQALDGRILAWNPGAQRMYGWSEAEALAMNIRDLIPESQREAALAMVRQHSRAEVLAPYHTQRIAKDSRIIEVWLTATTLINQAGEVYAIATTERATT
ncbi:MAG: chemotaxis protein CheB [Gemmatimonadales bacterium]